MRGAVGAMALIVSAWGLAGCGSGGSTEEFCALSADRGVSAASELEELDTFLDAAVDAAPAEIRDDYETIRSIFDLAFAEWRAEGTENVADVTPEQSERMWELHPMELQQAMDNIDAFIQENCWDQAG